MSSHRLGRVSYPQLTSHSRLHPARLAGPVYATQDLVHGNEFFGFREMAYVARMQDELGWRSQTIDFVYGRLQCPYHIRIRRLVKSHVTVADLDEAQLARRLGSQLRHAAEAVGLQDAPPA
jgi:hypothetical protein